MLKESQLKELKPGDEVIIAVPKTVEVKGVFVKHTDDGCILLRALGNLQKYKADKLAKYGKIPGQEEEPKDDGSGQEKPSKKSKDKK